MTRRNRTPNSLQARLERQQGDVTVAERTVAMWQQQMDDMVIRAPFAGVVTTKDAQPGEMISPISAGGGFTRTGIGTVVDMDSLEIEIDVNESYINRVEPGQAVEATLDAYPDWKIPCKVIAIIPDGRPAKIHGEGAGGFRPARSAHPAGDVGEGGLSETAADRPRQAQPVIVPKSAVRKPGRPGRGVCRAERPGRAPGGHGERARRTRTRC